MLSGFSQIFSLLRSQLLILNTSLAENGSYVCTAENRAGTSRANYTLVVESHAEGATVMEMKMEYLNVNLMKQSILNKFVMEIK